jgi:hypothetical protein
MASPASHADPPPTEDFDGKGSDYGSDLSPEEEAIVTRLLDRIGTGEGSGVDIEDNPILSGVEYYVAGAARVPRVLGRARWADEVGVDTDMDVEEEVGIEGSTGVQHEDEGCESCFVFYLAAWRDSD